MRALAVMFLTFLVACSGGTGEAPSSDTAAKGAKVGLFFDLGGRGDGSFNDSAAAGLDRAAEQLGVEARTVTAGRGGENREEPPATWAPI